jgi:hypothetical protein
MCPGRAPRAQPTATGDSAVDELPSADAKPEDALVFFQQQTSTMDREALLARVAEAAAKEADAVTKLGQLTCAPDASPPTRDAPRCASGAAACRARAPPPAR